MALLRAEKLFLQNPQQIVNNSRFLVLAPIKNLESVMLSCTLRELKKDWNRQYGLEPLLVETLVDRQRFHGGLSRFELDRTGRNNGSWAVG